MRALIAVLLAAGLVGCERGPQYTVVTSQGDHGYYLYRTNQGTGEVCAFRPYRNTEFNPKTMQHELKQEGFALVGCANK